MKKKYFRNILFEFPRKFFFWQYILGSIKGSQFKFVYFKSQSHMNVFFSIFIDPVEHEIKAKSERSWYVVEVSNRPHLTYTHRRNK